MLRHIKFVFILVSTISRALLRFAELIIRLDRIQDDFLLRVQEKHHTERLLDFGASLTLLLVLSSHAGHCISAAAFQAEDVTEE
ncbi:hypothetical protein K491DRAFT_688230 [Lophiostoma macrostomum CBS 122681]|uniref:Uncharacterized protein n=1 Tax=Lophiostoma macrostomum CBS 122681 TaxID=1314788 RepID=A0A6A6TPF5_9PLEO|nr:hypothetical protein K491DRAFT_688230 [Lophiostoma macrostomum CBS 122681]